MKLPETMHNTLCICETHGFGLWSGAYVIVNGVTAYV
jgi:hypothetical protein